MVTSGNTFYIILGMLNFEPKSGYGIKKSIEDSTGEFWKVNYGQIYPILKIMLQDGYAVVTEEGASLDIKKAFRPGKKVYRITQKGKDAFLEWLALPINFNNPQGNELLVKLFFGRFIPVDISIQRIKEYKSKCLTYQSRMKKIQADIEDLYRMKKIQADIENLMQDNTQREYSMMTVRNGLMAIEAKIAWCDECIERLSKRMNRTDKIGG